MISTHSSAVAAIDRLRETVLERCLPEVRLQAKLRRYLKQKRKRKLFIKKIKSKKGRIASKMKVFGKILKKKEKGKG